MSDDRLTALRVLHVNGCTRCSVLAKNRRRVVFGEGSGPLMIIGEAPGLEEDAKGRPFVGASGKRLDSWLQQAGVSRSSVFITNILKCHPPMNRDPLPEEISACAPFLHTQIFLLQPQRILTLGRFAGRFVSGCDDASMGHLQECKDLSYTFPGAKSFSCPVTALPHPSFALRQRDPEIDQNAIRRIRADCAV